eukprot:scaffold287_cov337-Pavlova_lutheri.AAC.140
MGVNFVSLPTNWVCIYVTDKEPVQSLVVRDKVLASSPWLRLYTRSHFFWNNIVCYKHDFWTSTLQVAGNTTHKSGRFHRHPAQKRLPRLFRVCSVHG